MNEYTWNKGWGEIAWEGKGCDITCLLLSVNIKILKKDFDNKNFVKTMSELKLCKSCKMFLIFFKFSTFSDFSKIFSVDMIS